MHLFYSLRDALKLVADEPVWNLNELQFSRIYGRKKSDCKHISGRMAHRLYLQGILLSDSMKEEFIERAFRDYSDPTNIFIKQSYIDFMMKEEFQTLISHSLNRIMSRLMKGFGFAANCIAERVLAFKLIRMAQTALVQRTELYVFDNDKDSTFYNSWPIERVRELLDANFVVVMEKECNIQIDREANKEMLIRRLMELLISVAVEQQKVNLFVAKWPNSNHDWKLDEYKQKQQIIKQYGSGLVSYEIGVTEEMHLSNVHPSKWFVAFNVLRIMDFYWNNDDFKRVKAWKRCVVCDERNNKLKHIKLKKCKQCQKYWYCSRKHQKLHWKRGHSYLCRI